mmetsp:Transcript_82077/g.232429  ORF Transcript_82077/g.232429 Transcript_82077/m.232429 type:complete len:147 (+) Transcript_82077:368-808(+)
MVCGSSFMCLKTLVDLLLQSPARLAYPLGQILSKSTTLQAALESPTIRLQSPHTLPDLFKSTIAPFIRCTLQLTEPGINTAAESFGDAVSCDLQSVANPTQLLLLCLQTLFANPQKRAELIFQAPLEALDATPQVQHLGLKLRVGA